MALACAMTIAESTVFEKLFHDDHPMGGRGMATGSATLSALCASNPVAPQTPMAISPSRIVSATLAADLRLGARKSILRNKSVIQPMCWPFTWRSSHLQE